MSVFMVGRQNACPTWMAGCPSGVPGTDHDHLKDTQEADATDGHSPPHSVQKEEKFAAKITADMLPPKHCHCLGDPFTEEDQGVGHSQVLKDQICEL